jgi:hypothetical protein
LWLPACVPCADAEAKAQASGKAFGDAWPAGKVWLFQIGTLPNLATPPAGAKKGIVFLSNVSKIYQAAFNT